MSNYKTESKYGTKINIRVRTFFKQIYFKLHKMNFKMILNFLFFPKLIQITLHFFLDFFQLKNIIMKYKFQKFNKKLIKLNLKILLIVYCY